MTRVNTGVKWEYKIRDYFEAQGYTVIRAAGSRGPADLIVWKKDEVILIQAKKETSHTKYDDDIRKLSSVVIPDQWKSQLWIKHNRNVIIYDVEGRAQMMDIGDMNKTIREASK